MGGQRGAAERRHGRGRGPPPAIGPRGSPTLLPRASQAYNYAACDDRASERLLPNSADKFSPLELMVSSSAETCPSGTNLGAVLATWIEIGRPHDLLTQNGCLEGRHRAELRHNNVLLAIHDIQQLNIQTSSQPRPMPSTTSCPTSISEERRTPDAAMQCSLINV